MRITSFLDSLTPVKFLGYVLPYVPVLFVQHYMGWVIASIALGFLISKSKMEKLACVAMIITWLIYGQQMGPWVPEELRGSWMVMLVTYIGFKVTGKMERKRAENLWQNSEGRD